MKAPGLPCSALPFLCGLFQLLASAPASSQVPTATRDTEGKVTVRAMRIAQPISMDGRLDERAYEETPSISDFIQQEPQEGAPATERTEAWIFFDNRNIYISARCWDSHPERDIAGERRRDASAITDNENFAVIFDTFHDKRNGLVFQSNSIGGLRDSAIIDETNQNADWNAVWDARTGTFEGGWTIEMVVPFKSLRYNAGESQVWGVNLRRLVRWKNEWSYLTKVPAYIGARGLFATSLAATMEGLEPPPPGISFEVKPYGISGARTDRAARPPNKIDNFDRDWGVDAKYGVTRSLTADFTYNTDFAQVEDDSQQVNLTRFTQFFPEKREFFLEGQGIFAFGGSTGGTNSNTPVLFFSRAIGLNNGRPAPILGGGRLTGKAGAYSIGMLNIQSEDDEISGARATNFSVVRIKRNIFSRGYAGFLYTRRQQTTSGGPGAGDTFGIDTLISASPALNVNLYAAKTHTPGLTGRDASYLGRFDYSVDRYALQVERLTVGAQFNPGIGFLRRSDFTRSYALARFSPRPAANHMQAVRRFVYQASMEYVEDGQGRLDTREAQGTFTVEMKNADNVSARYFRAYEFIPRPFDIATGVTVPIGGYTYQTGQIGYTFGFAHRFSGTISLQEGTLYDGTKRTLGLSSGRINLTAQFSIEPSASVNWVELPWGRFTSNVVTSRTTYTMTPRMFVSALVQYNSSSHAMSTNARFRWEYRPGSEMFVVYSDGRDTLARGYPDLVNRAFIVKANRLVRF